MSSDQTLVSEATYGNFSSSLLNLQTAICRDDNRAIAHSVLTGGRGDRNFAAIKSFGNRAVILAGIAITVK